MKSKRGLDQTSSWIGAFLLAGLVFTGAYFLTKTVATRSENQEDHEVADSDHGEHGHDADHGSKDEHDTQAESRDDHTKDGHKPDAHGDAGHGAGEPKAKADHEDAASGHHSEDDSHSKADPHTQAHADVDQGHAEGEDHHDDEQKLSAKKKLNNSNFSIPWSYNGERGPDRWGDLHHEFVACVSGKNQSPIDIGKSFRTKELAPIIFSYKQAVGDFINTGNYLEFRPAVGSYATIDDEQFDLISYQFHAPSEHKIESIPYDMEIQLIHKNKHGKIAIVAIIVEESQTENKALGKIWRNLPRVDERPTRRDSMNVGDLLPKNLGYYHYQGSLTTPPCSEGVDWYVLNSPIKVSARQIDNYISLIRYNARPIQPLHARKVQQTW